jgi:hypothetical protein
MTDRVQVLALTGSVLFLLFVLELVRRRRLAEEYSALWIVSALVLIAISLRRDVLDFAATWLGVYYPPAVLVLMLVAITSVASLSFSVVLSRQQRQIDRLIEENAIMAAELRELRRERKAGAGGAGNRLTTDQPLADEIGTVSASGMVVDSSRTAKAAQPLIQSSSVRRP